MQQILFLLKAYTKIFWFRFNEAVFVTNAQYRLRLLHYSETHNKKFIGVIQVVVKRVKAKFSIQYLASNIKLIREIHPVNACKLAFLANVEGELALSEIPDYIQVSPISCPIIKQAPTLIVTAQSFSSDTEETHFTISDLHANYVKILTATELSKNETILYSIGSQESARVGYSASNDFLKKINNTQNCIPNKIVNNYQNYRFYHILCMIYLVLVIAGLSIVRRMFPFQIPFTDLVIPFGGGILFFPLIFCIQDTTTEVYGFPAARQMVILSIFCILLFFGYTQLAIHLPNGEGSIYQDNYAFKLVFDTHLRQIIALVVSLYTGSLLNDYFISRSKIILAGQYLWLRLLGSTMAGEAVLQVVGGIIGFSDKLDFKSQLLPNMLLAYGYKVLWCAATIPLIYIVSTYLKKKEGIDVYDYDADYNPFKFSLK